MIPMACSLLACAALCAAAMGQTEYRPAPTGIYNVNVSPWPGQGRTSPTQPIMGGAGASSSDGIQQAGAWQPTLPLKNTPDKKEARPSQRAAGLAKPKAQEKDKLPNDNGQGKSDMPARPADAGTVIEPTPEQMFQLKSEKDLQAQIQKSPKTASLMFPPLPTLPPTQRPLMAPCGILVEPNYVDYRRLLFEDKNSERYGWNLGPIQPFVSANEFIGGMVFLPYKLFSWPCLRYDSNAGLCLPGDPVPYILYPPGLSLTGTAAEAGIVIAINYIFLIY
jgi:hypothetical protein